MIPANDFRKLTLIDWLENDLLLNVINIEPASSDASFRRYFRITLPDRQLVVMDAPPDKENIQAFLKVAQIMTKAEMNVPEIYHQNLQDGFLVLEDFGSQSYLDALSAENADKLYGKAFNSLLNLQKNISIASINLPAYDEALLRRELGVFSEWLIEHRLHIDIPESLWQVVCDTLINSALAQPRVCVHRDYHSRNLMMLAHDSPGIIDFQDAVIGPITYDLVSILRDCYIAWPQNKINQWLKSYHQQLIAHGMFDSEFATFTRWFDLMGMQRHLKAIGIFSRLDLRDGKTGYLKDIPRTLNYVLEQCRNYPEFYEFGDFLDQHVSPHFS